MKMGGKKIFESTKLRRQQKAIFNFCRLVVVDNQARLPQLTSNSLCDSRGLTK